MKNKLYIIGGVIITLFLSVQAYFPLLNRITTRDCNNSNNPACSPDWFTYRISCIVFTEKSLCLFSQFGFRNITCKDKSGSQYILMPLIAHINRLSGNIRMIYHHADDKNLSLETLRSSNLPFNSGVVLYRKFRIACGPLAFSIYGTKE